MYPGRRPAIDMFSFPGRMAALRLKQSGVTVRGSRILVLCDNEFEPSILNGLKAADGNVEESPSTCDAIFVALKPHTGFCLNEAKLRNLARSSKGALLVQFRGDIDRPAARAAGFLLWPENEPTRGHGGLKVGETMARAKLSFGHPSFDAAMQAAVESGFGQRI
jgi:hypothetical protein